MASPPAPRPSVCKFCGKPFGVWRHEYLTIEPLCSHELPPLGRRAAVDHADHVPKLAEFLQRVLEEAYQVDFDGNDWISHGVYPCNKKIYVNMPPLLRSDPETPGFRVPVEVEKRVKGNASSAWLARRSRHELNHVDYTELDGILARDHCGKEISYTPSVFDANELFKWDAADLRMAVEELTPEWGIQSIQMSIYQMCHEMPKVLRMPLLRDRIFHVLCITAHSLLAAPEDVEAGVLFESHTLQLPVNMKSFQDIAAITCKSHFRLKTRTYDANDVRSNPTFNADPQKGEVKLKHQGKKLTEGVYVSLERLREGPRTTTQLNETHLWDMMTRSDARGITRLASWRTKNQEVLDAIAEDVFYVLEHIRRHRRAHAAPGDEAIPK
ncbi:hypothetical protein BDU57DRAFT_520259 [Ampelomyces quisqualis]|uniref:DUF3074 domain-containing protein n=1 Tax=Ampelomyces quisqualis TaxID=50730 RepID=A0A6A5QJX0_AMPQU|nr:hypothetical protein BDU57DRAFT_520259 [Ampelomyces quisqualis]